ncbi:MAG: type II secretion system protein GspL [Gammaproteobacteria bacterium]|nr:type II secretion system protein GspL [Gammaproteobacteria bacterium]
MEYLVIRIGDPDGGASWQAVDAHGAPVSQGGQGELEQAAEMAEGRKVVLLIPAREVFRARLDLPARGRRSAVRGARYALEDRIAGDVEDLHFAVGPTVGDQLEVAAVERQWLEGLLERSREAGLLPDAVYGEGDALPHLPNAAAALLEENAVMFRDGGGQLVSARHGELAGLVDIACAEHAGDEAAPFRLVIYCEPALEGEAQQAMAGLNGRDAELRLLEQGVMTQLAAESMSGGAVNLLQGEFRRRDDRARRLRDVAIGLLAVALVLPGYLAMDGWRAQSEYQALAGNVETRLRQMMPDAGASADLRGEFRRRVTSADLSAAADGDGFLRLLQSLERGGGSGTRVLGINYGSGSAQVRLTAANMETLDQVRRSLLSVGYSVLIQTAVPESNGSVTGELSVRDDRGR